MDIISADQIFNVISLVIVSIIVNIGVAIGAAQLWISWREYRDRRLLNRQFSQGPYDSATIERSTQWYIRPKCSNIDPAQEVEIRRALLATREDLFLKIDFFLDNQDISRHLLILADSGTGKTSFVLNYYVHNSRSRHNKHKILLVPLGDRNADVLIDSCLNPTETVLFLDALDEDTKAIDNHRARIYQLMDLTKRFKKIVVTCRTQFFPSDEEIPVETGVLRLEPRRAGEKGIYEFKKLYLSPFDDDDVRNYLKKRYPIWKYNSRNQSLQIALRIPYLSARPMLLAHIPDILGHANETTKICQLYEAMVSAWIERESAWSNKEALRNFSELLAVDLYVNREQRGMERIPYQDLTSLAKRWGIQLDGWQLGARSLLNRDAQGNYKFAHRSIMEYLFILQLIEGNASCSNILLTDQMKRFLMEILPLERLNSKDRLDLKDLILSVDIMSDIRSNRRVTKNTQIFAGGRSVDIFGGSSEIYFRLLHGFSENDKTLVRVQPEFEPSEYSTIVVKLPYTISRKNSRRFIDDIRNRILGSKDIDTILEVFVYTRKDFTGEVNARDLKSLIEGSIRGIKVIVYVDIIPQDILLLIDHYQERDLQFLYRVKRNTGIAISPLRDNLDCWVIDLDSPSHPH